MYWIFWAKLADVQVDLSENYVFLYDTNRTIKIKEIIKLNSCGMTRGTQT